MEANERVMADDQFSQMYPIMCTNILYRLNPMFDGPQLKTAVQQAIETFNRTRVCIVIMRDSNIFIILFQLN
jgi:hypothetical protein